MTIKRFYAEAECNSCGHEQAQYVEMPDDYSDSDLREALDNQAHECDGCGDLDWASLGRAEERPAS